MTTQTQRGRKRKASGSQQDEGEDTSVAVVFTEERKGNALMVEGLKEFVGQSGCTAEKEAILVDAETKARYRLVLVQKEPAGAKSSGQDQWDKGLKGKLSTMMSGIAHTLLGIKCRSIYAVNKDGFLEYGSLPPKATDSGTATIQITVDGVKRSYEVRRPNLHDMNSPSARSFIDAMTQSLNQTWRSEYPHIPLTTAHLSKTINRYLCNLRDRRGDDEVKSVLRRHRQEGVKRKEKLLTLRKKHFDSSPFSGTTKTSKLIQDILFSPETVPDLLGRKDCILPGGAEAFDHIVRQYDIPKHVFIRVHNDAIPDAICRLIDVYDLYVLDRAGSKRKDPQFELPIKQVNGPTYNQHTIPLVDVKLIEAIDSLSEADSLPYVSSDRLSKQISTIESWRGLAITPFTPRPTPSASTLPQSPSFYQTEDEDAEGAGDVENS